MEEQKKEVAVTWYMLPSYMVRFWLQVKKGLVKRIKADAGDLHEKCKNYNCRGTKAKLEQESYNLKCSQTE